MENKLDGYISDLVADFLYYDRKECEELPRGAIEEMIDNGEVTVDHIVSKFQEYLEDGLN